MIQTQEKLSDVARYNKDAVVNLVINLNAALRKVDWMFEPTHKLEQLCCGKSSSVSFCKSISHLYSQHILETVQNDINSTI